MESNNPVLNETIIKSKIKQKYGFLIGDLKMFEEGRDEVIQENSEIKKKDLDKGLSIDE